MGCCYGNRAGGELQGELTTKATTNVQVRTVSHS